MVPYDCVIINLYRLSYLKLDSLLLIIKICSRVFDGPKLAQQWLVCAPLGMHLEQVNAASDNIIIINCTIWPKERTV